MTNRGRTITPATENQLFRPSGEPVPGGCLHSSLRRYARCIHPYVPRRHRQERSPREYWRGSSLGRSQDQVDDWRGRATQRAGVGREERRRKMTFCSRAARPAGCTLSTESVQDKPFWNRGRRRLDRSDC